MNFIVDISNHIKELRLAIRSSEASLVARVLATVKADPLVTTLLLVAGAGIAMLVHHL